MSNAQTALNELSALAALAELQAPASVDPATAVANELAALAALSAPSVSAEVNSEAAYQSFILNGTAGTTVTVQTAGKSITLSF